MDTSIYANIWEYTVKDGYVEKFVEAYGPCGNWARLFQKGEGYLATELHRDSSDIHRYVTVDYWESMDARNAFQERYSSEYEQLDCQLAMLTDTERLIGNFYCRSNHFSDLS